MKEASNILKGILIVVILTLVLIFAIQNLTRIPISFLNMHTVQIPLFAIIFGVLALGILIGYLVGLISGSKISKRKLNEIGISANEKLAQVSAQLKEENKNKISE